MHQHRPTKADLQKRPIQENYKRDLQKGPTKETYKKDVITHGNEDEGESLCSKVRL